MHRPIFFKLKFYLTSPVPQSHYRCNTFIMKGCNRFKILVRFQIFCIKSNENMVWACHLPKRWECPTIFGRKFHEIYVVRCQNMPPKSGMRLGFGKNSGKFYVAIDSSPIQHSQF